MNMVVVIELHIHKTTPTKVTVRAVSSYFQHYNQLWFPIAVAQVKSDQVIWDLWRTKWHWDEISQNVSVPPASPYSTVSSTLANNAVMDAKSIVKQWA
jgi:hypothetical protein